jgi:hypothetical protein
MVDQEAYHQRAMDKLRTGDGPSLTQIAAEAKAGGLDSSLMRQWNGSFRGGYIALRGALSGLAETIWSQTIESLGRRMLKQAIQPKPDPGLTE